MDDPARAGAAQPRRFDPARAARLDDPARFAYLPAADLCSLLDLRDGALLLDFGAGTGAYAIAIAQLRPDLRVLALDEQPEMLERLRANVAAAGVTTVEPLEPARLAEFDGSIDGVLAINVLHELGDAALASIAPLVRAGGCAVFADWNADVERTIGPPRDHVYGVREARERIETFGLRVAGEAIFPFHFVLRCTPGTRVTDSSAFADRRR